MKRFFHLMIVVLAAVCMVAGCQKYDDSELRKELQELREKLASLEAWCSSSQSAIDAVAVLQKAVENMNSVESIEPFIDADGATGYVITFTNKETIKLYNGKDGDTFFGNVVVNDDCIIFTLADGRTFTVPRKQDEHNYLAFEAVEAGATVSMEIVGTLEAPSLEFSTNKLDWTAFDFCNPQTITLENVGDKVYWRNTDKAESFSKGEENYVHFVLGEKKIAAKGNIMSLIDSSCESLTIPSERCFQHLFENCGSLTQAPELPATTLAGYCYFRMFYGCSALETAPELPAKNAVEACYCRMFQNCTSLKTAPELPAEEMDIHCYQTMFANCTSLKTAPDLPAPAVKNSGYAQMFQDCTSLEVAPIISFKKVDRQSCLQMFAGCTSLKKAPDLPAEELEYLCYGVMFEGCTALEEGPAILPAKQLKENCYYGMFYECSSLELAPELPATELEESCYNLMFGYCTSLESVPKLPATELADWCYSDLFVGCTSLKDAPELPASKMKDQCYGEMFALCTSLETTPALPATELADFCYISMFEGCTSLKKAPELPATNLAPACYANMFWDCPSLETAPELPATKLEESCYDSMFIGCAALTEAPELPAEKLAAGCYVSMFDGCSNLKHIKVGFDDWGDGSATADWVAGTPVEGDFECPEGLTVQYGDSYIPAGWSVNGAAPAATKSFAAPATAVRSSHRKTLSPKTPASLVEREMITL